MNEKTPELLFLFASLVLQRPFLVSQLLSACSSSSKTQSQKAEKKNPPSLSVLIFSPSLSVLSGKLSLAAFHSSPSLSVLSGKTLSSSLQLLSSRSPPLFSPETSSVFFPPTKISPTNSEKAPPWQPQACSLPPSSSRTISIFFLGFAPPTNSAATATFLAPRTEREVIGFLGRLQYISRFIARLTDICEPIFRLLRKSQPTVWDDQCQRAFERIREYLLSPPVLAPPTPGRPLLLYLSVSDVALGCMLAQLDDSGKDRAITI
ncbi:hypothetical protein CK203_058022 [Vitis vinifera]|uniref:Reverse transcriptase/retrotransposon-derived protein RNase H-like domain-containing protein n=1 Tax=Vitis vinifera TaxID=29760 RepID=A0A438FXM0_VITVI|nr:hypothetical protein CK203_058022 [Vitis vinifera]